MAESSSPIRLNAHQRRHFEVLLARLEDSLCRIESMLTGQAPSHNRLSLVEEDVPEAFRTEAIPVLSDLRARIGELANELHLQPRTLSRKRAIGATLNAESIRIEDSLSGQLRGYGEVDESVVRRLDPILEEMAGTLSSLAGALKRPRRASDDL